MNALVIKFLKKTLLLFLCILVYNTSIAQVPKTVTKQSAAATTAAADAQKQLVELLALMVNYQPENQLIITTHSPYILSVFSNLLFASRVVEKNPAAEAEVQEIIDKDCWLNPQEFSAYSLGNHSFPEEMQYCEPIFDNKMGNIKQNYLDTVSEILGAEFSQLYSIHGKTFKRK